MGVFEPDLHPRDVRVPKGWIAGRRNIAHSLERAIRQAAIILDPAFDFGLVRPGKGGQAPADEGGGAAKGQRQADQSPRITQTLENAEQSQREIQAQQSRRADQHRGGALP